MKMQTYKNSSYLATGSSYSMYHNFELVSGAICKVLVCSNKMLLPFLQHISNDVGYIFVDGIVRIQIFLFVPDLQWNSTWDISSPDSVKKKYVKNCPKNRSLWPPLSLWKWTEGKHRHFYHYCVSSHMVLYTVGSLVKLLPCFRFQQIRRPIIRVPWIAIEEFKHL